MASVVKLVQVVQVVTHGGLRGPGGPGCQCGPGGQCGSGGPAYALSMMLYISELRMEAHTSSAAIRLIWIVTQH